MKIFTVSFHMEILPKSLAKRVRILGKHCRMRHTRGTACDRDDERDFCDVRGIFGAFDEKRG